MEKTLIVVVLIAALIAVPLFMTKTKKVDTRTSEVKVEAALDQAKAESEVKTTKPGVELAKGKKYEVLNIERHGQASDPKGTILTDGVGGSNNWQDASIWLGGKVEGSGEISYIIDLGASEDIGEVSAQFHQTLYNIDFPTKIAVSVSDDKKSWYKAVVLDIPEKEPTITDWVKVTVNAKGRYVKVSVTPKAEWVWCSEISVKSPNAK